MTAQGCGYIPFVYCYGPQFGDQQILNECTLLMDMQEEIEAVRKGPGFVCADLEAEWNGNTHAATVFANAMKAQPGTLYLTTWANPVEQAWGAMLPVFKPVVHAFVPQQYTDWLATRSFEFAGLPMQPAVDLAPEFGTVHPVLIADQAAKEGDPAVWMWEYTTIDPTIVKGIVAAMSGGSYVPPPPVPTPVPAQGTYIVQPGDSLSSIALKFPGLTWQQIWQANKPAIPNPDLIYAGQVLHIPSTAKAPDPIVREYTVIAGDTLIGVANKLGVTEQHLLDMNHFITNPDHIEIGWKLSY